MSDDLPIDRPPLHPRPDDLIPRLRLRPATPETLDADAGGRGVLSVALDAEIPASWPPHGWDANAIGVAREMAIRPEVHGVWGTWYFLHQPVGDADRQVLVGGGGFKGPPDGEGAVDTGFTLLPEWQDRGLAGAALRALVATAFQHGARIVRAQTRASDAESAHVLERAGFVKAGPPDAEGVVPYRRRMGETDHPSLQVRPAVAADATVLAAMMDTFNAEDGQGTGLYTKEVVLRDAFGAEPAFQALIAWWGAEAVGYACFVPTYNTEIAARGLWLNDLWVAPDFRSHGIGRKVLAAVARTAVTTGRKSIWWGVRLDNDRAQVFYQTIGAKDDAAKILELDGAALRALAVEAAGV